MKYFFKFLVFFQIILFCFNLLADQELLPVTQIRDIGSQGLKDLSSKEFEKEETGDSIRKGRYNSEKEVDRKIKDGVGEKSEQKEIKSPICQVRFYGDRENDRKTKDNFGKNDDRKYEYPVSGCEVGYDGDRSYKKSGIKVKNDVSKNNGQKNIGNSGPCQKVLRNNDNVIEKKDLGVSEDHADYKIFKRNFAFNLQGAIALEAMYDTRQVIGYKFNEYTFFPAPQKLDATGLDINDKSQFNMLCIRTFCAASLRGPDIWNAKTLAVILGDFTGINDSTVTLFRLRKAFASLAWENTSLLLGHYYHPLVLDEACPETVSFGQGRIFDPFRYAPQIKLRHRMDQFEFVLAIAKVFDSKAARTAAMPDLFGQLNLHLRDHVMGIGISYHSEVPRLNSEVANTFTELNTKEKKSDTKIYKTTESVDSIYPFVFAALKLEPFDVRMRGIYAENGNVYSLIGGYDVESRNERTDERIYINLRSVSFWADIIYRRLSRFEAALFLGVAKNIGASRRILKGSEEGLDENVTDPAFLTLMQIENATTGIDYSLTFMPRLRVKFGELSIAAELEYTRTSFAKPPSDPNWEKDFSPNGAVVCGTPVNCLRILFSTFYNFDYCPFGVS